MKTRRVYSSGGSSIRGKRAANCRPYGLKISGLPLEGKVAVCLGKLTDEVLSFFNSEVGRFTALTPHQSSNPVGLFRQLPLKGKPSGKGMPADRPIIRRGGNLPPEYSCRGMPRTDRSCRRFVFPSWNCLFHGRQVAAPTVKRTPRHKKAPTRGARYIIII